MIIKALNLMIARQLEYIIDNKLNGIFNLTSEGTIKYNDLLIRIIKGLKLDNIKI